MPIIELRTEIKADIELCFDLARSINLHSRSLEHTNEKAIGGVTSGLIGFGEEVCWQAKHLGINWTLTSKITQFARPYHFRDSMQKGPFKRFDHDHIFESQCCQDQKKTIMIDRFDYESPFGLLGSLADILILKVYMRNLLRIRNEQIKKAAESQPELYL